MRPLFGILALVLVVGCPYDPYAHLFTTTQPTEAEVAGGYLLTQQTIAPGGMAILKGQECVLELRGDGTFSVTNYPTWSDAFSSTDGQFMATINTTGRWSCDTIGAVSNGRKSQDYWGVRFSDAPTQLESMALTGQAAPYGLMLTYGDPDTGAVMIFERR